MSGHQEQQDGLEQSSSPDPLDAALVMTQPPERGPRGPDRANGHGRPIGTGAARAADSDPYLAVGDTTGRHRSPRSLFDPGPAPDHGRTRAAGPADPAAATETLTDTATETVADTAAEAAAESANPVAGASSPAAGSMTAAAPAPASYSRAHQIDRPNLTPVPGSRADLGQRLERLPYGHPSSPYHVDGERKPPPPRLKHLELAPPVADRSGDLPARPSQFELPVADQAEPGEPGPADVAATPDQLGSGTGARHPAREAGPYTLPAKAAPPYPPPSAEHDQQHSRPMPTFTPAKAGPPPPAAARPMTAGSSADAVWRPSASRPGPGDSGAHPAQRDSLGAPSGPAATAQARSLPTGRGPGFNPSSTRPRTATDGSWTWGPARLTSDQVRIAEDGYDRFRAAEGRDLFGGYGGSGLTAKLRQVEGRLDYGRLAPGTEERALLEPDVFRARFADMLRRHPDRSPELLASRVPGALSYAFIFGTDHYADGILLVQDALEAQGFDLQARKNSWNSVANRCVFTMWHDPLSELPFEVQFHTSASLEAQQLARTSATLINDPGIPPDEAASLRADLASAWAALPSPPGNAEISDYRRYGSTAPRR